jgi:ribose transport system permease protein
MITSEAKTVAPTSRGARDYAKIAKTYGPYVALVGLVVVFTILNPAFFTLGNLFNILRQIAVLLVLATGASFVILMGSIDLSVGSVVTMVGLIGAWMARKYGLPWILVAPALGMVAGLVNGWLFAYAKLPSFLVTLGTLFAINGVALYIVDGRPIALQGSTHETLNQFFVGDYIGPIPNIFLWAVIVYVICILVSHYTRFGRFMFAIGSGEKVAELSGVPVKRYKLYCFVVAGLLAAIGGILLTFRIQSGSPGMGEPYLLTAIAAAVIGGTPLTGGIGGPSRTIIGVLIIGILQNGMIVDNVHPFLQILIQGLVVIIAVALTLDRSKIHLVK